MGRKYLPWKPFLYLKTSPGSRKNVLLSPRKSSRDGISFSHVLAQKYSSKTPETRSISIPRSENIKKGRASGMEMGRGQRCGPSFFETSKASQQAKSGKGGRKIEKDFLTNRRGNKIEPPRNRTHRTGVKSKSPDLSCTSPSINVTLQQLTKWVIDNAQLAANREDNELSFNETMPLTRFLSTIPSILFPSRTKNRQNPFIMLPASDGTRDGKKYKLFMLQNAAILGQGIDGETLRHAFESLTARSSQNIALIDNEEDEIQKKKTPVDFFSLREDDVYEGRLDNKKDFSALVLLINLLMDIKKDRKSLGLQLHFMTSSFCKDPSKNHNIHAILRLCNAIKAFDEALGMLQNRITFLKQRLLHQ